MTNQRNNNVVEMGGYKYAYFSTQQLDTIIATGSGVIHSVTVLGGTAGNVYVFDATEDNLIYNQLNLQNTNAIKSYRLDMNYRVSLHIITSAATKVVVTYS